MHPSVDTRVQSPRLLGCDMIATGPMKGDADQDSAAVLEFVLEVPAHAQHDDLAIEVLTRRLFTKVTLNFSSPRWFATEPVRGSCPGCGTASDSHRRSLFPARPDVWLSSQRSTSPRSLHSWSSSR